MVFSAPLYTNTTTGNVARPLEPREPAPNVDLQALPAITKVANNKHDVYKYTMVNAGYISLAGVVTGAQEAYYAFERMPPPQSRQSLRQAGTILNIIGRKTLAAGALGAIFCATEATLENYRHKHDMTNGMVAGAVTGLVFALIPPKPLPQPVAWPIAFALVAAAADIVGEKIPACLQGFKFWGALPGRENWGDPEPPRPPVLDTGSAARPQNGKFWRGG